MERHGNKIVSTEDEQRRFGVAPSVPVSVALDTADAFMQVAATLNDSGVSAIVGGENTPGCDRDLLAQQRCARAANLMGYAAGIYDLCPDEHLARIASSANNL